ncbi:hypothetical protein N7474_010266 [Penicillium riverlandense]|uniref:uncharacterized protein n=1 Tax=Penicillium riverlandense TaxID=1903569 RepID=UPI0025481C38|nr:uncharacterized protein N7474_010266 [Penicillium riverlandense]KAJ5808997.1 hypothetical protein N7474_010266 [Penicillium riverlandense]
MWPTSQSVGQLPVGRTGHACVQCRHRKQKCGGFTRSIKCRPCTTRKVKCSFEEEVKDPRHNPYLCLRGSRSPSIGIDTRANESTVLPSSSAAQSSGLTVLDRGNAPRSLLAVPSREIRTSSTDEELPKQIELLKARIAELEKWFVTTSSDSAGYMNTPQSRSATSLGIPFEPIPSLQGYSSPPVISLRSTQNPDAPSLSSSQGATMTDGPLKALNSVQSEDPVDFELHDPIARTILTEGEAHVMFRLYFSHPHPNAPFLDTGLDSDVDNVRQRSVLLFLAILCIGARFWGASSRSPCWLHHRYPELVRLLDAEVMRVTLRPRNDDQRLETIQALMLCAHWMPFDISADSQHYQSRFSEAGAWQCLGLAIRWAGSLVLNHRCYKSFKHPETATRADARRFRTMLYLVESDHYLALSARRPSYLDPKPLHSVLNNFLRCQYVQTTDLRLASLFRVAYSAHFSGCRPITVESVEAFNKDVELIEDHFTSSLGDRSMDALSKHFPFTSLRWYRLSYACAFLDVSDPTQRTGKVLTWAIEWASQILLHTSHPPSTGVLNKSIIPAQLEPDPSMVDIMSFAIDHYYVVISYAAFFLVNSWLSNLADLNLRPHIQQPVEALSDEASSSLLFRLVDVATRTLEAASPPEGHLARRYFALLRGMANIILSGNAHMHAANADPGGMSTDVSHLPDSIQNNLGEDLWEMWQQAGLEATAWPSLLDDMY